MKHLLLTIIAAVVLVGCGDAEEPTTHPEQPKLSDMRKSSMSPLNIAAEKDDLKAVKELLDSGVDIDSLDHTGTPLNHAAGNGHKEIVELLIAKGADVNAKADYGLTPATPLHNAARKGHKEIAELLIAKGADVNAIRIDGTPLHSAAQGKKEVVKEVVELLIANGADVNAKNKVGRTPLNFAIKKPEIAGLLRKHGGKTGEELKAEGQ